MTNRFHLLIKGVKPFPSPRPIHPAHVSPWDENWEASANTSVSPLATSRPRGGWGGGHLERRRRGRRGRSGPAAKAVLLEGGWEEAAAGTRSPFAQILRSRRSRAISGHAHCDPCSTARVWSLVPLNISTDSGVPHRALDRKARGFFPGSVKA